MSDLTPGPDDRSATGSESGAGSPVRSWRRAAFLGGATLLLGGGAAELAFSPLQSWLFTRMARGDLFARKFEKTPPAVGPIDIRLCYDMVEPLRKKLGAEGYVVSAQTPWVQHQVLNLTLPPHFNRPQQSGISIRDMHDKSLYESRSPSRIYSAYQDIPPVLVRALELVEDRQLAEDRPDRFNAAINWGRFANSTAEYFGRKLHLTHAASGGSTLAIQIDKNESSPGGRTVSPGDKLRQMASASVTMYSNGPDTRWMREETVRRYLNVISYAGHPKVGEVFGFRDAMAVWFANPDFEKALAEPGNSAGKALALRQTLTLVMAVQKPDRVLRSRKGFDEAQERLERFVPTMVKAGIIDAELSDMVVRSRLSFADVGRSPVWPELPVMDKSVRSLRNNLIGVTGLKAGDADYRLNSCDLGVKSTLDGAVNAAINQKLRSYNDPDMARSAGLTGFRLLSRPDSARDLIFGITVKELKPDGRVLTRVSTDTYPGALDLNKGGKQNFGSTGKLRMLGTYLHVISELHQELADKDPQALRSMAPHSADHLTRWSIDYLTDPATDHSLKGMLEASLERKYSGALQGFFTGGGMNYPHNFDRKENGESYTVKGALWHSVNLSWFRISQDIENYYTWNRLKTPAGVFDPQSADLQSRAMRTVILGEFAQYEGGVFLARAYKAQQGKSPETVALELARRSRGTPAALAIIHMAASPLATPESMSDFVRGNCKIKCDLGDKAMLRLYEQHHDHSFDLNDRGYLTKVHPMSLRLLELKARNPRLTWGDADLATRQDRIDIYKWLLRSNKTKAQNRAITIMLQQRSWKQIEEQWKSTGYPYRLVPSLATVIGVSGDNTEALTTYLSILLNRGRSVTSTRLDQMTFAAGTPHEMTVSPGVPRDHMVFAPEVAELVLRTARGVVEEPGATARRLNGVFKLSDGTPLVVRGKTGTNDEAETVGLRGAFFTGTIGDHLAVTIQIFSNQPGGERFTSALAAQVLKSLAPELQPLTDQAAGLPDPATRIEVRPPLPAQPPVRAESSAGPLAPAEPVSPPADEPAVQLRLEQKLDLAREATSFGRLRRYGLPGYRPEFLY